MKVGIGADIVPTRKNSELFIQANTEKLLGNDLKGLLASCDYLIMNLETPLTNELWPIDKCGEHLFAPEETIKGLKAINPFFYTLANNHIMDHGNKGLENTIRILKDNNISFGGIGHNLSRMAHSFSTTIDNVKLGIYCCAEHEFSIADEYAQGVNPFDPLCSFDHVAELKKQCDYVIVLYHGGKEHYRYPSPMVKKMFHKFSDVGADLVIAQHTHCIGCYEKYNHTDLVYGQGNFLFIDEDIECWKTSLFILLEFEDTVKLNFIPLVQTENGVKIADSVEGKSILTDFFERSEKIKDEKYIQEKYNEFSEECLANYLVAYSGNKIQLKLLKKLFGDRIIKLLFCKKDRLMIQNYLECEAHIELFLNGLKLYNRKSR